MASEEEIMVLEEGEVSEEERGEIVVEAPRSRPIRKEPAWKGNAAFKVKGKPVREIEIFIFPGMLPQDQGKVPVICHGHRFEIMRGEWVKVPISVRNVLQNAVVDRVVQIGPAPGSLNAGVFASPGYKEISVPRFNFQWRNLGDDE